jgi:addiction module RelE/StbE family toxin
MLVRVKWTRLALDDLERARAYLQNEAPHAVAPVFEHIQSAVDLLVQHPLAGRLGRVYGTREWVVQDTSYLIGYRIAGDVLQVLRVLHSRQRWPKRLG